MTNSQNGWTAYANTSHFTRFTAAGQGWWAANDDVATVFAEFINRFDTEVEEITQNTLDDWSYANRLVRGSTSTVSNHGSATAIDLNALKHPRGVHNTFSAAKRSKMHAIRNAITDNGGTPVLRLGMDYTGTVDDMHVEINVSAARVKQAAAKIRKQHEEDDVSWSDTHKLTEADVKAYDGDTKVGDKKSYDELVRFPPATARLRREMTAQIGALTNMVAALAEAIKADGSLTAEQASASALEGARTALAELEPEPPLGA
jgi:N-methylhydantoinase B/oxoprolinase/acetone carboxylase alpha subunit